MASLMVKLLHLLLAASAASLHFSDRFFGGSLTFTPKGQNPNGTYKVELHNKQGTNYCQWNPYLCFYGNCGTQTGMTYAAVSSNSFNFGWCQYETVTELTLDHNLPFGIRYPAHINRYYGQGFWAENFRGRFTPWRMMAHVDLGTRSDTGHSNRSPITTTLPLVRVTRNCPRSFNLTAFDPDGDRVRCRIPTSSSTYECGLCGLSGGFSLDQSSCSLVYRYNNVNGYLPIELVVEDFPNKSIWLSYSDGSYTVKHPHSLRRRKRQISPTTAAPTTAAPTTAAPTTAATTTAATTTAATTTAAPTTAATTTAATTTAAPTTTATTTYPTTTYPTTTYPTTTYPTTTYPTTTYPTTTYPTTTYPTTTYPTTTYPTTTYPTTTYPTTTYPTTTYPTTTYPTTTYPTTTYPTTTYPTTTYPTTTYPTTTYPTTTYPTTTYPTTTYPTTTYPTTTYPTTTYPTTTYPTTTYPTTTYPTTTYPTTTYPTTTYPTTTYPTTTYPTTTYPTTTYPTTTYPTTTYPTTTYPTTTYPTTTYPTTTYPTTTYPTTTYPTTTYPTTTYPTTTYPTTTYQTTTYPTTTYPTTTYPTTTYPTTTYPTTTYPTTTYPTTTYPTTTYPTTTYPTTTYPTTTYPTTTVAPTMAAPTIAALSKLPLQFSVFVDSYDAPSCLDGDYFPIFLSPTPSNGVNLPAFVNKTLEIKVKSRAQYATIVGLVVTGPKGISKQRISTEEYVIKWTPAENALNDHFPICFISEARERSSHRVYQSELRCVIVDVGHYETTVTCNETTITLEVEKSYLLRRNEDNLHLNDFGDASCNLSTRSNATHLVAVVPLNMCGTVVEEGEDDITFQNKITSADLSQIISRQHDVEILFSCVYPKRTNLTLEFRHKNPYAFKEKGFGTFTFQFEFFESQRFRRQVNASTYPVEVDLKQMMFMQIEATTSIPDTQLFVESCRATPYDNPNSRIVYTIIEHGCARDQTVQIYPSARSQFRFGMEAFEFIGAHAEVYITCSVLLCEVGVSGTRCSQGCMRSNSGIHRVRRAAVGQTSSHFISQGPLRLVEPSDGAPDLGLSLNLGLNLVFVGVCLVACGAVIYRVRRSKAKYEMLPSFQTD